MTTRLSFVATCVLAAAILALVTPPARARDFTWDGNFNNLWDRNSGNPGYRTNWDPQGMNNPIPTGNDNVFFHGNKPNRTINLNGDRRVLSAEFWGDYNYTLGTVSTDTLSLVDGIINASGGATHEIAAITELEAYGVWDISGANTLFRVSGLLRSSSGSNFRLEKTGSGTLELTGGDDITHSSLKTLWAESGIVVLDGASIELTSTGFTQTTGALLANSGDITIQNGADVLMVAHSFGFVKDGALTITGTDSSLSGDNLYAALEDSGSILVEDSASLDLDGGLVIGQEGNGELIVQTGATAEAGRVYLSGDPTASAEVQVIGNNSLLSSNHLDLGGLNADLRGGTATLTVDDGAAVEVAGKTHFWTSASSMIINGGTFVTNRLTAYTGVAATVSISDPTGDTAFTVGTNDGSSTFDGLIQDAVGGPGSLKKLGSGTLTLTGANTYSGGTIIDGGALALAHSNAAGTGPITVLGSTIDYADTVDIANPIDLQNDVTLNVASGAATQSGAIGESGGSFGVAKTGNGTLTLSAANTFSGTTNINAGSIIVNHAGALQDSTVSINVDGGLDVTTNAINAVIGALAGTGDLDLGSQFLRAGGNDATTTYSGVLSGTGGLTKTGAGTLTLTGANTYAGGTTISGGILAVSADANLGDNTGSLTFDGGDLLFGASFDLNSARAIALNAGGGTIRTNVFNTTISQRITGAGGLIKEGTGTLTFTGANTYSGETTINKGTIIVGHADALKNSTVSINLDDGLDVTTNTIDATIGALAGSGALTLGSQELLTGGNGADTTYSGVITGTSDSILRHNGAGTLTLTVGSDPTASSLGTLRAQSGAVVVHDASIDLTSTLASMTTGALSANGGDITISGADVRMVADGFAYVGSSGLGSSLTVTGIDSSLSGGDRLDVAFSSGETGSILVERSASLELAGDLTIGVAGDGDLTVRTGATASADAVLIGVIGTGSGQALVKGNNSLLSSSSLHLGSNLGGTGTLTVDGGGAVRVAGETKFWTSSSSMTIKDGTFETDQLKDRAGEAVTVTISDIDANTPALTVGTNNGSSTFDGLIQGTGSLMKVGSGTLTLTGANTYSGGTIIDGGTLLAGNTTGSATGSGPVQVNSGGTLGGTGSVAGPVTVASGGTLAPGASVGTFSLGNNLTLESGSTLAIDLGGPTPGSGYDQLDLAGTLSLGGAALDLSLGYTPGRGDQFAIINYHHADPIVGEFDGLPDDSRFRVDGYRFGIDYQGGDGNDVVLTASWAEVTGRHVFYDNSSFDNPLAGKTDDNAIATDKHALMPGDTADFANYTSYSRGINGIMVDVDGLDDDADLDFEDFDFKVGNDNTPGDWGDAPDPTSITIRQGEGEGGSDRITILWEDNAIEKEWLRIVMLATDDTGLLDDDVFYFGNAIGESGTSPGDAKVNAIDMLAARNNPHNFFNQALIDDFVDFDRDARVNATDMLIARNNTTNFFSALRLITVPGIERHKSLATVPEPGTLAMLATAAVALLLAARRRRNGNYR